MAANLGDYYCKKCDKITFHVHYHCRECNDLLFASDTITRYLLKYKLSTSDDDIKRMIYRMDCNIRELEWVILCDKNKLYSRKDLIDIIAKYSVYNTDDEHTDPDGNINKKHIDNWLKEVLNK